MVPRLPLPLRLRAPAIVVGVITALAVMSGTRPGLIRAVTPTALINGDTVVDSIDQPGKSDEQIQAEAAGFAVTVVDGTTWDAMSQAAFNAYNVLIVGDPECSAIAPSVTSNIVTWTKAVMDSGGNRFTIASDPVFHSGTDSTSTRNHIILDGIRFAGAVPGTTGAYVDTSCDDSTANTDILNALSLGGTGWTVESPACAGNIGIVASVTGFVTTDADLSDWFCSSHADYPTWAPDWVPFAISADAPTQDYCAKDVETGLQVCGEPYILLAGSGVVVVSDISLSPASATNVVGTNHTVTATVVKDSAPLPGKVVTFTISSGPNAGATGTCAPVTCITDASGQVAFTYTGTGGVGTDTIVARFTDDSNRIQQATAGKTWTAGVLIPTTTAYTGASSVQYSDAATLSGHLQETSGSAPIAGRTIGFTVGTQSTSAGPTDSGGNASTSLTITQKPGTVSTVETSFSGDATYAPSSDSDPFAVLKEDCTLTYSGDLLVGAGSVTTLSAQFGEPDTSPGDWSNKTITFTATDSSNVAHVFGAVTDSAGVASVQALLPADIYAVGLTFAGDDFYKPCATATDTLVTVQAAGAKITGGGFITPPAGRVSFGFNAISDVTGLRGQLQVQTRAGKNRFHANTVLTLVASGNAGTWTGTGRWNGVDGYSFTVSVADNGPGGRKSGDTISITISLGATTVFTTGGPITLQGGNITVH